MILKIAQADALCLKTFKEFDNAAIADYRLPLELMMENAGAHLALLVSQTLPVGNSISIGVGPGNNGGGGLVAARRLAAWGYQVFLDIPIIIKDSLILKQLDRAISFGAKLYENQIVSVWIDAYFGFSQRFPLPKIISERIEYANAMNVQKYALDLPTGLGNDICFEAEIVLCLAAPKQILYTLNEDVQLFLADLGIPKKLYTRFGALFPPFDQDSILEWKFIKT